MWTTDRGDNDFTTSFGDDPIADSNIGEDGPTCPILKR